MIYVLLLPCGSNSTNKPVDRVARSGPAGGGGLWPHRGILCHDASCSHQLLQPLLKELVHMGETAASWGQEVDIKHTILND